MFLLLPSLPTGYWRSLSRRRASRPRPPPRLGSFAHPAARWERSQTQPLGCQKGPSKGSSLQGAGPNAGGAGLHLSGSPERKPSTSAGRKGSKGVRYTSCFLPLRCLRDPLHPRDRGLRVGRSCWVVPAPEGTVTEEQTSSSLPVLPRLPQHPSVLTVGSGSSSPTGLQATEASPFPTGTGGPAPSAQGLEDAPTLRRPGSCPCAPCPGRHPGSAGPKEGNARLLQVSLPGHSWGDRLRDPQPLRGFEARQMRKGEP